MTDLQNQLNLDYKQTIPAADIKSSKYDEGMSLYLQSLGLANIDTEYNKQIKEYEAYLQELEFGSKLQASILSQTQANASVEAQANLGTGAKNLASIGHQKALDSAYAQIESNVAQAYQEGMAGITENYQTQLENVLGEYDPVTGTFADLASYEAMSNAASTAFAKVLAQMLDSDNTDYLQVLKDAGYIESTGPGGEIVFTAAGQKYMEAVLNGISADTPNDIFDGKSLSYALALQMAKDAYSGEHTSAEGLDGWSALSDSKQSEIVNEYQDWLVNNMDIMRLTEWDMYEKTDDGYVLNTMFSSSLNTELYHEGVDTESGIDLMYLTKDDVSDCTQEEFDKIKMELVTGKISDGTYFVFQSGKAYDDDKFYYVSNGRVYKTQYTVKSPPKVINVDQASVYSFGIFQDTGTGKFKQDKWIQEIIDSAKAGRIPDGTYISFNYGASATSNGGWYVYRDGQFLSVNPSETVVHKSYTKTSDGITEHKVTLQAGRSALSNYKNVIVGGYTDEHTTGGIDVYLDW